MLFMTMYIFERGQENEIAKKQMQRRSEVKGGFKVIGDWISPDGHKGFILFEAEDEKAIKATTSAWSDIMRVETVPVISSEEAVKLAKTPGSTLLGLEMKL